MVLTDTRLHSTKKNMCIAELHRLVIADKASRGRRQENKIWKSKQKNYCNITLASVFFFFANWITKLTIIV